MQKATIYLDETLWRTFRKVCIDEGITASQQMTRLIEQYLTHHHPTAPAAEQQRRTHDART
jgi:hypothetical protein